MEIRNKIILAILILIPGIILHYSALAQLVSAVIGRQGSSHGVFIPFISAYFMWYKRDELRRITLGFDYRGLVLFVISLIPLLLSLDNFHIRILFFFVFVTGIVWTLFGYPFLKAVMFPLLYLITMIPIPGDFYISMANLTRDITYVVSTWIISVMGLTFYQDGYFIYLPNAILEVALSCSGIRYLVSFFVFSLAYAYITRTSLLSRVLVVLSCFPLSIAASVTRLTTIYLATYFISPRMAEPRPHIIISWLVFFSFLFVSMALDQHFNKAEKLESGEAGKLGSWEAGRLKGRERSEG